MHGSGQDPCRAVRDLLPLAVGQDLSETAARRVWGHLADCMACRREYSAFLDGRRALASLEPGVGGGGAPGIGSEAAFFADLQGAVMDRVHALATPARVGEAPPRRVGAQAALWLAAAGIFLVGLLVFPRGAGEPGLLDRQPMAPQPAAAASAPEPEGYEPQRIPLSYPQGLAAQRQAELLFSPEREGLLRLASYSRRSPARR